MSLHVPQPSQRLVRAAAGERDDLITHRKRLAAERDRLVQELESLDSSLAAVDARVLALDHVLGDQVTDATQPADQVAATRANSFDEGAASGEVVSGPAIRERAVQVLLGQDQYIEALHYRRWYELLNEAGYVVRGKDPLAVFLTQLTRSPVVRKSGQSGVYELDRQAPLRLRQRLERLRAEMRELSAAPASDSQLGETRARRHELDLAISQTERALEEALSVLRRDETTVSARAAAPARLDRGRQLASRV